MLLQSVKRLSVPCWQCGGETFSWKTKTLPQQGELVRERHNVPEVCGHRQPELLYRLTQPV